MRSIIICKKEYAIALFDAMSHRVELNIYGLEMLLLALTNPPYDGRRNSLQQW